MSTTLNIKVLSIIASPTVDCVQIFKYDESTLQPPLVELLPTVTLFDCSLHISNLRDLNLCRTVLGKLLPQRF